MTSWGEADYRDPTLVASRHSLALALDALSAQREAITIVGAHAVHERTTSLLLASTTTKDGDVALDPGLMSDHPHIEDSLRAAGFRLLAEWEIELRQRAPGLRSRYEREPGLWALGITDSGDPVGEVDLLVPSAVAGSGRRSVGALRQHGSRASKRADGLELAVLDRDLVTVDDWQDDTTRHAYVAGHAGLICAKAYKLAERIASRDGGGRDRVMPKDAVDLWRCVATSDGATVRATFERHVSDPVYGTAISKGLGHVSALLTRGELHALVDSQLRGEPVDRDPIEVLDDWAASFGAQT